MKDSLDALSTMAPYFRISPYARYFSIHPSIEAFNYIGVVEIIRREKEVLEFFFFLEIINLDSHNRIHHLEEIAREEVSRSSVQFPIVVES